MTPLLGTFNVLLIQIFTTKLQFESCLDKVIFIKGYTNKIICASESAKVEYIAEFDSTAYT